MLVFIYKFVKWGAARHKRHKQSRRTRGKTCCYNCVYNLYCVWSTTGMFTENWQRRAQGWAQSSLTPISCLLTLCSPIVWLLPLYFGTWGKLYRYFNKYLLVFNTAVIKKSNTIYQDLIFNNLTTPQTATCMTSLILRCFNFPGTCELRTVIF